MPDLTKIAAASVTAPAAGAVLCSIAAAQLPAGQYQIETDCGVSGNAVADLGNIEIRRGGVVLESPIPQGASGGQERWVLEQIALDGTQTLDLRAIGAGTAAIEYNVTLKAIKVG